MIGQTISHYKILEKLGEGGMGIVYKADDTKLKRRVALKFLPKGFTKDKEAKKRFIQEARAAAGLDHQNICNVYEINETEENQMFIAMAHYEGETLKEKLASGPLSISKAINFTVQIAEGLKEAHEKGIVHRDIKSANIMITQKGQAKIMDFGLAKLKGQSILTKIGTTVGTAAYMSPEQAVGKEVDHRTDIWSLGVVLYEMLTGKLPFKGDYEQAILYSIVNEKPEPVTTIKKDIPAELDNIISKTFEKNPNQRYTQVNEILDDLNKLGHQYPIKVDPMTQRISHSHPFNILKLLIPGIALLVSITIIATFFLFKGGKKSPTGVPTLLEQEWTNSVAVLPFRDFSPRKDQEYFCEGMTDAIIDQLTRLQNIKVTALTSVLRYKNTDADIKTIGKDLGVQHIVEGTVQREDSRIRVRAQLIKTETGFHLWSDSYDRTLESVFEVQDDISLAIANALKVKFKPQKAPVEKSRSIEAYEYYLKGLFIINNTYLIHNREEDFHDAVRLFEKAFEIDPTFAEAYSGLSWAYQHHAANTGSKESQEMVGKYAKMAYKLNPHSSGANVAMGWIYHREKNDELAYSFFKRAKKINPNRSGFNAAVARFFYHIGLYQQAITYNTRAHQLDPFYYPALTNRGYCFMYTGDYQKAILDCQKALSIKPDSVTAYFYYVRICIFQENFSKAKKLIEELERISPDYSYILVLKATLYAAQGNKEKALATYSEDTWPGLQIYSILSMKKKAFELMDKGIEKVYIRLKNNPFYDKLRDDPRFQKVLRQAKEVYEERLEKYGDF